MLIRLMPAHDALGHEVPTYLEVTAPNVVTLTVEHHKEAYVYPVIGGPAFEVGYSTVEVIPPVVEEEDDEEFRVGRSKTYPPVPVPSNADPGEDEAVISSAYTKYEVIWERTAEATSPLGIVWYWSDFMSGTYMMNYHKAWWRPYHDIAQRALRTRHQPQRERHERRMRIRRRKFPAIRRRLPPHYAGAYPR
jgi:hypothetical protein